MVFNSYSFILIFLPLITVLYYQIRRLHRPVMTKAFLLAASLFFYGYHHLSALTVLIVSIAVNYAVSLALRRLDMQSSAVIKKAVLILGIVMNLSLLFYCKYLGFFGDMAGSLLHRDITLSSLLLPLGISYYTFSQIAYLVDCYRDPATVCGFLNYALFVSFFPKITVGPIALSTEMVPMFDDAAEFETDYGKIAGGLMAFSFGLAKKMMLADTLGQYVDFGYANVTILGSLDALLVMTAYTLQIYFDFSGCCDMARGICLMLGMDLPQNFDSPYRSLSINEFWKRWHITLTRFFRKYVYFPLGGNRKGKVRTYFNQMLIFLLSGLWHGASLSFLLWGAIHGIGIIVSKLLAPVSVKCPKPIRLLLTFTFVNFAWVYFRAPDITIANIMFMRLFTGGISRINPINADFIVAAMPAEFDFIQWFVVKYTTLNYYYTGMFIILIPVAFGLFASIFMKNTDERIEGSVLSGRLALATAALLFLGIVSLPTLSVFIYENF